MYEMNGKEFDVSKTNHVIMCGCIYMDQGEWWPRAKKQLDHFIPIKDKIVFSLFRVVCKPSQKTDAKKMVKKIEGELIKLVPQGVDVDVGITVYKQGMGSLYLGMSLEEAKKLSAKIKKVLEHHTGDN